MRSVLFLAFVSIALASACADDPEIREGVVAPLLYPCEGEGRFMCQRLEDKAGDGRPGLIYGSLVGYQPRWGVEAHVRYHVETIADPPADGSSLIYVVDEVVTEIEDAAGPEFELPFRNGGWFAAGGPGRVDMAGTEVLCDTAICEQILDRVGSPDPFEVRFTIAGPQTLRALGVQ